MNVSFKRQSLRAGNAYFDARERTRTRRNGDKVDVFNRFFGLFENFFNIRKQRDRMGQSSVYKRFGKNFAVLAHARGTRNGRGIKCKNCHNPCPSAVIIRSSGAEPYSMFILIGSVSKTPSASSLHSIKTQFFSFTSSKKPTEYKSSSSVIL